MPYRSRPSALAFVFLALVLLAASLGVGCGRSSLEDSLLLDGGTVTPTPEGGVCSPATCPTGCCDARGVCRTGTDLRACGIFGQACSDCTALGQDTCDATRKACGRTVTRCNSDSCSTGCCATQPNGTSVCLSGQATTACGGEGERCTDCSADGRTCDLLRRSCAASGCGPLTCPSGCCVGGNCVQGRDDKACGSGGGSCADCASRGQTCDASTSSAVRCVGTESCGPQNCGGCCLGTVCVGGFDDTACGKAGQACTNCGQTGRVCSGAAATERTCQAAPGCGPTNCKGCCLGDVCVDSPTRDACGVGGKQCQACSANQTCDVGAGTCQNNTTCADTCPGCCQGNQCFGGFLNNRCGSGGAACQNCQLQGTTCDTAADPRACRAQPVCPSTYGQCPNGVTTAVRPRNQNLCTASELQDLRAACAGGADSAACVAFFAFLQATNSPCAGCLSPFNTPFAELTGIYNCVAPFVGAGCNRSTGCEVDCEVKSCSGCVAGAQTTQCRASVQGGQCQSFVQQSGCILTSLIAGQGSFCNPANPAYGNSFGNWIGAVGAQYCGP